MSPRAALRLEHLGFRRVYDYVPGKSDWTAAGLPREGKSAEIPNAGDVARLAVPLCHFRHNAPEALEKMKANNDDLCVAIDDDNIVLGMVSAAGHERLREGAKVEDIMRSGSTTIRANEPLAPLVERMKAAGVDGILVTNAEGRLLGLLYRDEAEETLRQRDSGRG